MTVKGKVLPFVLGLMGGFCVALIVETAILLLLVLPRIKTPEQLAEALKDPPIPMAQEADYALPLKTLTGESFDLATLRGKAVFLMFWNPGCLTCKAELATVQTLYDKTQGENVAFVLASVTGTPDEAVQTCGQYQLTMPAYMTEKQRPQMYATPRLPMVFILSPDGKVAFKHVGAARWDGPATIAFLRNVANPAG